MSVSPLLGNPKPQWVDLTGAPQSGGTLTFNLAGAAIGAENGTTYTDSGGGTANDNPLSLNSRGEPESSGGTAVAIYGIDGISYDVYLKDSSGSVIWSILSIKTSANDVDADLANATDVAKGDALVAVKKTTTGAVATTQHELNERVFDIFDYLTAAEKTDVTTGAKLLDISTSIQACYDAAAAAALSIARFELANGKDSGLNSQVTSTVEWPAGKYNIATGITIASGIRTSGQKAHLVSESLLIALFTTEMINIEIKGMIFDGGKYHIKLYSATRTEASFVHIHDCAFRFAQTRCIFVDRSGISPSPGFPMTLQINNCLSYGSKFLESHTNGTFVSDCWIAWNTSTTYHDGGALFTGSDKLNLVNVLEVPYGTNAAFYPRFEVVSGDSLFLTCSECRFGGEATKTPLIVSAGDPTSFVFDNCALYGMSLQYWARFDTVPEQLIIRNDLSNDGAVSFTDTWGIWFNSATITSINNVPDFSQIDIDTRSSFDTAEKMFLTADHTVNGGARMPYLRPKVAGIANAVLQNYDVGDGITFWGGDYDTTNRTGFGSFSGTVAGLGHTLGYSNGSSEGHFAVRFTSFTAPAAGMYTFHCRIKVTSDTVARFSAERGASGQSKQYTRQKLYTGWNWFKACFYHDGSTATLPEILVNGGSTDVITIGLFAINQGALAGEWQAPGHTVESVPKISYGAAAPVANTWRKGDIVYNTAPAAGGTVGWICTTAGTPGTFKTFGAITA